ncbi:MAG: hypothetical protein EOP83_06755 [Verrucomicrobiaceae bacterium]|nr:MAG: hypothetical protein EOP83_06755 [Verrucomicrobiaceae bacterium]
MESGKVGSMKALRILTMITAVALSSCGFATKRDIPASHPRAVVLKEDLLLHDNPLRRRPVASKTENPLHPTLDVVKRGTRITFEAWLNEQFIINPGAYLLCRTEEEKPRVFEYYVGPSGGISYRSQPPWNPLPGHEHLKYLKRPSKR